jgi:hypothetical protein
MSLSACRGPTGGQFPGQLWAALAGQRHPGRGRQFSPQGHHLCVHGVRQPPRPPGAWLKSAARAKRSVTNADAQPRVDDPARLRARIGELEVENASGDGPGAVHSGLGRGRTSRGSPWLRRWFRRFRRWSCGGVRSRGGGQASHRGGEQVDALAAGGGPPAAMSGGVVVGLRR